MPSATLHIGMPAWRESAPYLVETLDSVLTQAGANLRVLISVDGNDAGVVALCERFLADPRVSMVVQPTQLGWVGNCNVVLQAGWESGADFYCIQPSDDIMEPGYLAALQSVAASNPGAAVVYSDITGFGQQEIAIAQPSVVGTALQRQLILILGHFSAPAFRGLIRRSLFPHAPPLLQDKDRKNFAADTLFLSDLARGGDLIRHPEPLYRKRYHQGNTHMEWWSWPDHMKIAAWTTHCAEMLQLALPVATSRGERRLLIDAARSRLLHKGDRQVYGREVLRLPKRQRRRAELRFEEAALGRRPIVARLATLLGLRSHRRAHDRAARAAGLQP